MCTPTDCRYLSEATHLLLTVGAGGEILQTDSRRSHALGHETSALAGQPLATLVPDDQQVHLARLLERVWHTTSAWDHVTFLRADGRPEPLLCCFQRIRTGDEPEAAVLVTGLRLEPVQQTLRAEAAAALGHLAFTCHSPAHRLMEALVAVEAECPASQAARRCRDDLDHLLEAVSRASTWPTTNGGPVDAVAVVEAALESLDADPSFAGLETALRPEAPAAWTAIHPAALAYVVLHLAANARDATSEVCSPHLAITVATEGNQVILEFQDNGRGIRAEQRDRAFAPCAVGSCLANGRAGVGLATCRQLLDHFGGGLHLHGRPTKGTTAVVTVPAADRPV